MAIDTFRKRTAALRFGMPWMSGTRPPGSSMNSFERAALLGLYHITTVVVVTGLPSCGWVFGPEETVLYFSDQSVVATFGAGGTLVEFGDC